MRTRQVGKVQKRARSPPCILPKRDIFRHSFSFGQIQILAKSYNALTYFLLLMAYDHSMTSNVACTFSIVISELALHFMGKIITIFSFDIGNSE